MSIHNSHIHQICPQKNRPLEDTLSKSELYATAWENLIRGENNIPLRTHYAFRKNINGVFIGVEKTSFLIESTKKHKFYPDPKQLLDF